MNKSFCWNRHGSVPRTNPHILIAADLIAFEMILVAIVTDIAHGLSNYTALFACIWGLNCCRLYGGVWHWFPAELHMSETSVFNLDHPPHSFLTILLTLPPFRFGVTLRRLARRRQQRFVFVIVNPAINIYIVCLHQLISVIYLFFLNPFYPSYSELFYKMLHSTQLKFISMLYLGPVVTLGLYVMSRVG